MVLLLELRKRVDHIPQLLSVRVLLLRTQGVEHPRRLVGKLELAELLQLHHDTSVMDRQDVRLEVLAIRYDLASPTEPIAATDAASFAATDAPIPATNAASFAAVSHVFPLDVGRVYRQPFVLFFSSINPPFYATLVIINFNSFRLVPFFHSGKS